MKETPHDSDASRSVHIGRAEKLNGSGVLLPTARTNPALLIVRQPETAALPLPTFQDIGIVRTKLVDEAGRTQLEQPSDLRYVVSDVRSGSASLDRGAVLGTEAAV